MGLTVRSMGSTTSRARITPAQEEALAYVREHDGPLVGFVTAAAQESDAFLMRLA